MQSTRKFWGGALLREGLRGHRGWPAYWGSRPTKAEYDVVIVGAGGHGLATAYYLAKQHGISRVAVIEKGWLGGGNTGRNTTVLRSNYIYSESAAFYDFSLKLYEGLTRELNYNIMFSPRGVITLAHSPHDVESLAYWSTIMRCNGVDCELLSAEDVRREVPLLRTPSYERFPLHAGMVQRRAGIARHDAVAWGYARAAHGLGVDIIQGCEVQGFDIAGGAIRGVETTQGTIRASKVAITAAGRSAELAAMAGVRLPMILYTLQAFVSEPVKPVLDTVILSLGNGTYASQSDKGELVIGGSLDLYPSQSQRGNFPTAETVLGALVDMCPRLARMRLMRLWGGTVDVVHDSSPLIGKTDVGGLYVNCGWGTGGFKAIPAGGYCLAHTIAKDDPHPLVAAFGLDRFKTGAMIDEAAAAGIAH